MRHVIDFPAYIKKFPFPAFSAPTITKPTLNDKTHSTDSRIFGIFFLAKKMQRFVARRVLSETSSLRLPQRCFVSQLAQKEESSPNKSVTFLPKMPPFDYSPPPYNGPSADEILAKRKTFLSPSLFHLYNKPVSPRNLAWLIVFLFFLNIKNTSLTF